MHAPKAWGLYTWARCSAWKEYSGETVAFVREAHISGQSGGKNGWKKLGFFFFFFLFPLIKTRWEPYYSILLGQSPSPQQNCNRFLAVSRGYLKTTISMEWKSNHIEWPYKNWHAVNFHMFNRSFEWFWIMDVCVCSVTLNVTLCYMLCNMYAAPICDRNTGKEN